jgi:hypothetical protein
MERSPEIDALAAALAKAQGAMANAEKDATNPFLKTRYTTLGSVWNCCREPLSANGLAVSQGVLLAPGVATITTLLMHSSGQSLQSVLSLPVKGATAQDAGAAITYARRYALSAMVGVAPEDDGDAQARAREGLPMITDAQVVEIARRQKLLSLDQAVINATLSREYQASSVRQLTEAQAVLLLDSLRGQLASAGIVIAPDLGGVPSPSPALPTPAGGAPVNLQEALAVEQAGAAAAKANGNVSADQAWANCLAARDSYFACIGLGDEKDMAVAAKRTEAWRNTLAKRGVTPLLPAPPEVVEELTATYERLVEQKRQQAQANGVTCAAGGSPPVMAGQKS